MHIDANINTSCFNLRSTGVCVGSLVRDRYRGEHFRDVGSVWLESVGWGGSGKKRRRSKSDSARKGKVKAKDTSTASGDPAAAATGEEVDPKASRLGNACHFCRREFLSLSRCFISLQSRTLTSTLNLDTNQAVNCVAVVVSHAQTARSVHSSATTTPRSRGAEKARRRFDVSPLRSSQIDPLHHLT